MDMELAARLARRANVVDEAEKAKQVEVERGNKSFTQNKSFTKKSAERDSNSAERPRPACSLTPVATPAARAHSAVSRTERRTDPHLAPPEVLHRALRAVAISRRASLSTRRRKTAPS